MKSIANDRRRRAGFTRVDLLATVVLALLASGVALPRLLAARLDAAGARCQDNLRTLGQGCLRFETAHGGFPARRTGFNNGSPYGGWGPQILPYIGEDALANQYNRGLDFFDPGNKTASETQVGAFHCPAAPASRTVAIEAQASAKSENPDKDSVFSIKGGTCDYITSNGVLMPGGGYGLNAADLGPMIGNQRQPMGDNDYVPLSKISDGLSCTLLLIEQAGRPEVWRSGKKKDAADQFGMSANARGAWAGWGSIAFGSASATTGESPGKGDASDCAVNCNNSFGIYGFHDGGANVLLCDGSVRFVSPKLDPLTFLHLTIRDDGQLIAPNDF